VDPARPNFQRGYNTRRIHAHGHVITQEQNILQRVRGEHLGHDTLNVRITLGDAFRVGQFHSRGSQRSRTRYGLLQAASSSRYQASAVVAVLLARAAAARASDLAAFTELASLFAVSAAEDAFVAAFVAFEAAPVAASGAFAKAITATNEAKKATTNATNAAKNANDAGTDPYVRHR